MTGDRTDTGKPDGDHIDVRQEHTLRAWSVRLGVSSDELRRAVQAVGPMEHDVRRYLDRLD